MAARERDGEELKRMGGAIDAGKEFLHEINGFAGN